LFNVKYVGLLFSITLFDTEIGNNPDKNPALRDINDYRCDKRVRYRTKLHGSQIRILISLFYKSAYREFSKHVDRTIFECKVIVTNSPMGYSFESILFSASD
jgi:hypothetical protein